MGQWIADNVGTSLPLTPTLNLDMITTLEEFFSLVECISLQQKIRKLGGGGGGKLLLQIALHPSE